MLGSIPGNFYALIYFSIFQFAGITLASLIFKKEGTLTRILLGSVTGSLLLQWVPVLLSFFFDFGRISHILALITLGPIFLWGLRQKQAVKEALSDFTNRAKHHKIFLFTLAGFFLLWIYLLHTHTIPLNDKGAMLAGQCSYGDMNMHLGFITSLANQGTFPPDYSIYPGTRLSYPFLSDSISSSLYLFGSSLRFAYILPMLTAFLQVAGGVYLLGASLLNSRAKGMLTFIFFFLNGGFGFSYFLNWSREPKYTMQDLFNGFYKTPTNLVDENIRWVNIIADMLLPQRATLFGYAVLFSAIYLLYQALFREKKEYFLATGLFASCLPMIHTHSFLGMGLVSAAWLLLYLYRKVTPEENRKWYGPHILVGFLVVMYFLHRLDKNKLLAEENFLTLGILGIGACALLGVLLLIRFLKEHSFKELLSTWGIYLVPVIVLALPQLLFWTFGQVSRGGFVRGHFNWGNQGESYLWFYLKNMGLPLLLMLGAIVAGRKRTTALILPAGIIWFVVELIVFTPNTYDNNKLLYIAYLLLSVAAADYGIELYKGIRNIPGIKMFAGIFLFFCTLSGILTLGREVVSEYILYDKNQVAVAQFIEENTTPTETILTNPRHNNEIAALTGRNIVCGADNFLHFHGIDSSERKNHLRLMYEAPGMNRELFTEYDISYVVISSYERTSYEENEEWFKANFELAFTSGDMNVYRVK